MGYLVQQTEHRDMKKKDSLITITIMYHIMSLLVIL